MARIIDKARKIFTYEPGQNIQDISNAVQTAMRLKIVADRYTRGFVKADVNGPIDSYEREPHRQGYLNTKQHRRRLGRDTSAGVEVESNGYTNNISAKGNTSYYDNNKATGKKDVVTIVDIDHGSGKPEATKRIESLDLQFRPPSINISSESAIATIPTIGRNNPFYNYGGSEDTLSFEISFYAAEENRQDVLYKCRWLESLTKADGYNTSPHRIKLVWGTEGRLFFNQTWILVSAPYTLSHFIDKGYNKNKETGDLEVQAYGLLPTVARQQLTFKKITTKNNTYEDILDTKNIVYNPLTTG